MPRGLTAVLNQPGKPLELETLPTPEVEPGGMLIKNTAAAICGSDLHYWRNDNNYKGPDMRRVPGHEFTGVVHRLGKGVTTDSLRRPLKEGDRVAFPFFNPCNRCYWCMRGEHHACPHRHRKSQQFTLNEYPYCDGGYAEYYYLPPGHYVFKVPDVLPDEAIPPVNCALCQVLHGIEYSDMKFGDTVVIQGAGGLGIYAAAVAAEKGASKVISIDKQTPPPGHGEELRRHRRDRHERAPHAGSACAAREGSDRRPRRRRGGRGGGYRRGHARRAGHGPLQRHLRGYRQHHPAADHDARPPRSSRSRSSGAA